MAGEPQSGLYLCDAHNHLQDERLTAFEPEIWQRIEQEGIRHLVVNGSCEKDWPAVLALARQHPQVIPSFGYHPWYAKERPSEWQRVLSGFLDQVPSAVGEIGLDRWVKGYDTAAQEQVFRQQLQLAAERNLPVTIHCLQAWGRLYELLRAGPRLERGFVLHSFGGPQEMVEPLAKLGAYFSLPGYFAHERKVRQREAFGRVPPDRLLLETDAPDQPLPPERVLYPLPGTPPAKALNHPANLRAVYEFAAELLSEPLENVAERVRENFSRVFGFLSRSGSH